MVVTKVEFQNAMREINESFSALYDRVKELEESFKEAKKEEEPKRTVGRPKKAAN